MDDEWDIVSEEPALPAAAPADPWAVVEETPVALGPPLSDPGARSFPRPAPPPAPAPFDPYGGYFSRADRGRPPRAPDDYSVSVEESLADSLGEEFTFPSGGDWWNSLRGSLARMLQGYKLDQLESLEDEILGRSWPAFRGGLPTYSRTPEELRRLQDDPLLLEVRKQIEEARATGLEISGEAQDIAQRNQGYWPQVVMGSTNSLAASAPALATTMATRNPLLGASVMYPTTAESAYGELREQGVPRGTADKASTIEGLIEVATELPALSPFAREASPMLRRFGETLAADVPGETIATLGQSVNRQMALADPNDTTLDALAEGLRQGLSELPVTYGTVLATAGAHAGVGNVIDRAREAAERRSFRLTPPTPEELAAFEASRQPPEARNEPFISDFDVQPPLPFGNMQGPALTGSRAPESAGVKGTAPIPPAAQGTAQPPAEAPLSSAFETPEPAASPAPPAPQEPASAPAPAVPAVSPAQEPPAGEVALPIPVEEEAPEARGALERLRKDTGAYVRTYASDPISGDPVTDSPPPPWHELGNGWAAREYVQEVNGERHPVQEMRNQTGKVFRRGFDLEGTPLNTLPPKMSKRFDTTFAEPITPQSRPVAPVQQASPVPAQPGLTPAPPPQQSQPRETGLVSERTPEARQSLSNLLADPDAYVRKHEPTKTGGWTTTDQGPEWTDMGNGFAARQYINEYAGTRMPVQEIRSPNGGIAQRGLDTKGEPYGTLDVKGIAEFERFFNRGTAPATASAPPLPAPGKPLARGEVYPTPEGPARENVGAREEGEGTVIPMTTTPDKFEEVINEFPALFEAPKKRKRATQHPEYGNTYLSPEEAAKRIESWQQHAEAQSQIAYPNGNSGRVILSLFDLTGNWARPFADAGYDVRVFDLQNGADIRDFSVEWFADNMPDIASVDGILIACPCTDFAGSGARWWKQKDADGQTEASKELVFQALRTVEFWRPRFWALENPVGRIEELTGLPPARYSFQPNDFGDPYTKRTLLWGKFNTDLPVAPVAPTEGSKMHSKFGGKSQRTKNARSETPEGFAASFFMANNYLDATPAERLLSQFPETAGAIEQALAAGFTEEQIREVVTDPYENYEYAEARDALRQLVKGSAKSKPKSAPVPAPETPEPAPAAKGKATGKRETVVTAAGTKVETEFEVVDAADLVTSDSRAFPQEYQPRERGSRAVSAEQVAKIASNIDPEQLGSNRHAEHGAPIIGKDDNLVESGNGRVMALRQMYARSPEAAEKYRAFVAEQSGQDVSDMKAPILVRRRVTDMTPFERAKFTKEANKTAVAKMSAAEQARLDQDALTPDVMAKLPDEMPEGFDLAKGEGSKFVSAFVSKFSPAERGELVDADGKPSSIAVSRAKAALLSKAYGGTPAGEAAIRRAVESTSGDAQTLVNTLVRFAPAFAKLKDDIAAGRVQDQADIGGKIAEAIEVVRAAGSPAAVSEWLNTEDMLDPKDDTVKQLIQTFYNLDGRGNVKRLRTGAAIGSTLSAYISEARQFKPEQAGGGLFGDEGAAPALNPAAELGKLNAARQAREQARERQETAQAGGQAGLFTAGGQPSAAVLARARDEDSGEETRPAGPREIGDASRVETPEEGDEADFLADELRRPKRRKFTRQPGPYSMTREGEMRASALDSIWTDAGLDPDMMELASPKARFQRAAEIVQKRFGFRSISKDNNLNWQDAIDALKDAYVGLSNFAAIQDINPSVLSLNGRLALEFHRNKAGALAYYDPGRKTIGMVRRNDAFAHEWAHALDHWLVETFAPELMEIKGRHLTGKTRAGGEPETMDEQVRDSFIDVLNAMFFDAAKAALYVNDLEKKIADAKTDKVRAKWQKMLDNFRAGHSKAKSIESEYYKAAKATDQAGPEGGGKDGYWQRPTEMFARAFEAYIAHKLAGLPADHPFVTQSDRMYNEGRIGTMRVPYPQAIDRDNIFAAMDTLMRAMRDRSLVDTGNAPAAIEPTDTRYWKKLAPSLPAQVAQQARSTIAKLAEPFKRQLAETHRADREARERAKQDQNIRDVKLNVAGRAGKRRWLSNQGLRAIEKINALPSMLAHTIRGVVLSLEAKHKGNNGIAWLRMKFATDPGSGRTTGATFNDEVRHRERDLQNRFSAIVKKHNVMAFDDTELRQLRDVLVEAASVASVPAKITAAAADMRRFMNDMYVYNTSNGVNIGYAKNGYLPRIVDSLVVENDIDGFRAQARALYSRVYPREVGTLDSLLADPLENANRIGNLTQYVREIAKNGNVAEARAAAAQLLPEAKRLEDALAELQEASDNGDDTAELEEEVAALTESIYNGLRDPWAIEAANDWEMRIRGLGAEPDFAFESRGPDGKYSKSRVLPEETDAIMGDYLKNDPLELITTYISQSVRRVEFGKFFGNPTKDQKLGWKLDAALHAARMPYRAADGSTQRVDDDDFEELQKSVELMVGRYNTNMTRRGLRWRTKLTAVLTPVILARSLMSQLSEPITTSIISGDIRDGFRVVYKQLQDVAAKLGIKGAKEQAAWRREMAEYFGIVADHMADQIMLQRYNLMDLNSSDRVKMARFFHVIGVHPHAVSMRRGVAEVFMTRYAPKMAQRALGAGPQAVAARGALAELGIDSTNRELLAELSSLGDIKDVKQLDTLRHLDAIRTAINRFTDSAIQDPKAVDKPRMASMPEYSFIYGIMSFNFAYQRNVLIAGGKRILNAWKNDPKIGAATTAATLAGLSILVAGQLGAWILRSLMFSDDDWEDIKKKVDEDWLWQSMSRAGLFGAADPIVNAFMGLKYERDLAQSAVGPLPAYALGIAQDIGDVAARNSPNTPTAEYHATEAAWKLGSIYVASKALSIAGANPYLDAGLGVGLAYLTSDTVTSDVAETVAEGVTGQEYVKRGAKTKKPYNQQ